jgi:hypothetical protein
MKIKEIINRERENDRSCIIRRDENGVPTEIEVIYCGNGSNQMALPHTVGFYHQTLQGWERDD